MDQMGIPVNATVVPKTVKGLFGDTTVLEGDAFLTTEQSWTGKLFANTGTPKSVKFRAIPYCFWDNRTAGEMRVWVSPNPVPSPFRGQEVKATVSTSFANSNSDPAGSNDGYIPSSSGDNSPKQMHFWPHKGGEEWVQYSFPSSVTVSTARVFWFDDTGHGECRIPKLWKMQVREGSNWKAVTLKSSSKYGIALDGWNEVNFSPVSGREFRLLVSQQEKWASGLHEWQIY
jgi:hypothetical protein